MLDHERVMTDEEFEPGSPRPRSSRSSSARSARSTTSRTPSPTRRIQAFKECGLGALPVPKEYGGLGGEHPADLEGHQRAVQGRLGDHAGLQHALHHGRHRDGEPVSDTQNKYWRQRVADGDIMFGPFSEQRAGFSGLADMKAIPQPERRLEALRQEDVGHARRGRRHLTTNATITDADGNLPEDFEERVAAESFSSPTSMSTRTARRRRPHREDLGRPRHARHRHPRPSTSRASTSPRTATSASGARVLFAVARVGLADVREHLLGMSATASSRSPARCCRRSTSVPPSAPIAAAGHQGRQHRAHHRRHRRHGLARRALAPGASTRPATTLIDGYDDEWPHRAARALHRPGQDRGRRQRHAHDASAR